jgi:mannose-6-phosphate isomerase-like protein (cupin superfamily)
MKHFPDFMKDPANAVANHSQSPGVMGYVFDGIDGSQMVFWECHNDGISAEHTHDYDEYMLVVDGCYMLIMGTTKVAIRAGHEYHIPRGVAHSGEYVEGTRTIHAFGGKRAERKRS